MDDDVIIVGGGYAGLSAALQLARARRNVVIIDAGKRRNRFTETSHGLLGRDGHSGAQIAQEGLDQVRAYPTVRWVQGIVTHAKADGDGALAGVATHLSLIFD